MQTNPSGLALVLSLGALAAAGYLFLQERPPPDDLDARLAAVERRLADLEAALGALEPQRAVDGPELALREPRVLESRPTGVAGDPESRAARALPGGTGSGSSGERSRSVEEIAEIVGEAVEKKAAQLQAMREKKPPIEVFARVLQLSDLQRQAVEQEVIRAQGEIKRILEIPAEDGTVFLDELVDILADGIAQPGRKSGRGVKLFGRLMAENIPGTDETYAARAETIKSRLRATFKRNWTEKQFATFESWQMDPTEIKGIEGSPYKEIEARVIERARQLGAEIPGDRR